MVSALLSLQVKFGVLQLSCQPLCLLLQLLDVSLGLLAIGLQVADLRASTCLICDRTEKLDLTSCWSAMFEAWWRRTHPPLQLPFVLLLHLQLVVELLLQPLLGELDLPDGSFVLQPPLASCRANAHAVMAQIV